MMLDESTPECDACPLDRRGFLGQAFFAILAASGMSSVTATAALALEGSEATYSIPARDGVEIDKKGEVILVRDKGVVYAFALSCPHQKQSLRWKEAQGRFECPKHRSKYQPNGSFIAGRATRAMDRHPIRREGDIVRVDLTLKVRRDEEPERWESEQVRVG
ncbi:MAG: Rieske (2Fe-2S) protein [Gemmatimonadetes bacterium]|nr:Rieske (2Fe-2S) protein [Gemmatimonadota bacterium]